ncbi:MAG: VOC family protein [Microthrixaceae bacterium]
MWLRAASLRRRVVLDRAGLAAGGVADAGGPRIAFQRVPEPKVGKVRLHLDLGTDDLEGAVRRAVSLGAGRLGDPVTDAAGSFVVLADPEGHEFCVVTE